MQRKSAEGNETKNVQVRSVKFVQRSRWGIRKIQERYRVAATQTLSNLGMVTRAAGPPRPPIYPKPASGGCRPGKPLERPGSLRGHHWMSEFIVIKVQWYTEISIVLAETAGRVETEG